MICPGFVSDCLETLEEIAQQANQMSRTLSLLLASVAAISLVVGGIVIMNIMLMAVAERTREIGIRKALGAKRRDILAQFLIESIIICLIGGGVGIVVGIAISVGVLLGIRTLWGIYVFLTALTTVFTGIAIVSLLVFRGPLLARMKASEIQHPDVDSMIGEIAIPVDTLAAGAIGKVELRGTTWSARNAGPTPLTKGQRSKVTGMDGLTLLITGE